VLADGCRTVGLDPCESEQLKRSGAYTTGGSAAETYLADHPVPRSVTDLLKGHALIGKDRDTSYFTKLAASGLALKKKDFALRTDNDAAYLAALRAGVGIGICQVPLAAGPPTLRRLLPKASFELPVWVVTHEDLRASRRVAIVFDHLVASLAKYIHSAS
jgi:DNA-binding transcriptional LysR family regulator